MSGRMHRSENWWTRVGPLAVVTGTGLLAVATLALLVSAVRALPDGQDGGPSATASAPADASGRVAATAGPSIPPTAPPSGSERTAETVVGRSVDVPGTSAWVDTGVDVQAGQEVRVDASGRVFHNETESVPPDGTPQPRRRGSDVLPERGHGALLGRFGEDGAPFFVGSSALLIVQDAGRLYLGINDLGVDNNAGAFAATVVVEDS